MPDYKILADSLTGVKGKQLLKGQVHPSTEITEAHIADLVAGKLIEEVKPPAKAKKDE